MFVEPETGKELRRHSFRSKVKIDPGKRKGVRVYTNAWPAGVVSAVAGEVGGGDSEKVEIKRVFYSDGSMGEEKCRQPPSRDAAQLRHQGRPATS